MEDLERDMSEAWKGESEGQRDVVGACQKRVSRGWVSSCPASSFPLRSIASTRLPSRRRSSTVGPICSTAHGVLHR